MHLIYSAERVKEREKCAKFEKLHSYGTPTLLASIWLHADDGAQSSLDVLLPSDLPG